MTDAEISAIKRFEAGDYLLRSNTLSIALHKHVPASRDALYTTKPEQVLEQRKKRAAQAAAIAQAKNGGGL